ncbi:uncharacterized protein Z519_01602 [Cladophialophora bantiana CBS 173.52]|uniref:Iron-sulfur cluster assembly factor IBA57 homolog, mitochondrial n=1 Tax=Cladophialophora bantiana (strain ATCC 10958 / CBS 173.52 / CDC B-1940 / NIH 8579) TaxID=1442370 RepID=A0A0D2HXC3_CLAB1|nr:uncharacterized protein Z519_01602 [Cladophialophora bantiana CBS 173.52]KIW98018.1 hypothetical protein Z519_01602 [Cladophialophora bantiana CBS 173.52]
MPPRLKVTAFRRFICPECQTRSRYLDRPSQFRRTFRTSPRRLYAPSSPRSSKHLHLTNRSIIRLAGPDAALFLHNLIPAKILDIGGSTNPIYTAFLSAQGRILNDVFIYPPPPAGGDRPGEEWFIEVDSASAGQLLKHLKKHKLRAKFTLEKVDAEAMGVYYTWPSPSSGGGNDLGSSNRRLRPGGQDPRPGMGVRWLDEVSSHEPGALRQLEDTGIQQATLEEYTIHRMLNGVAEGQSEIISGHALPQESNIDFFGGIDFFKGCYLGQELTIRTHHTGVVRKRILPCQLYATDTEPLPAHQETPEYKARGVETPLPLPPPGSNICKMKTKGRGRSSGKWLDGVGNIGLALCRLEMMTDIQLTADRTNYDPNEQYRVQWEAAEGEEQQGIMLKPFVPQWLREGVEQSLRRKERKAKPRREEDDDEEID